MNIQILAHKRNFEVQKTERYFKERGIPYQFVDLTRQSVGLKVLESVCRQVGLQGMVELSDKDWQSHYICQLRDTSEALRALCNQPTLLKTPIVRNGQLATVGYQPDVWAQWK